MVTTLSKELKLTRKVRINGTITFETSWRVGSGKEGETMSDLGVVLGPDGVPILPGSSLKGKLRNTCESLAHALTMTDGQPAEACLLNYQVSGVRCTSDVKYYHNQLRKEYQQVLRNERDRMEWLYRNTCDVCKLFGSP